MDDKSRIVLKIKPLIWKRYKKKCKEDYLIPSFEIEKFMKEKSEWM